MDWVANWNWMQGELKQLEDARIVFDAAFDPTAKRSRLDKANAAVGFSRSLCHFLSRVRDRGVFDAIQQSQGDQGEVREQLVKRLGEFLREEEILLERAGLKPEKVQEVMKDIRAVTQPPYPRVPQDLWNKHIKQAIDVACNFPKSSVLLVTHNIFDYVNEVRKKYKWVSVVVVGTVDGLSAVVDPTVIGTAKISAYVAMLMGVGHKGEGGGDNPPDLSA